MLNELGVGRISMYESRTGKTIEFNSNLRILNEDEPPPQIQKRVGNLTSIYHGSAW